MTYESVVDLSPITRPYSGVITALPEFELKRALGTILIRSRNIKLGAIDYKLITTAGPNSKYSWASALFDALVLWNDSPLRDAFNRLCLLTDGGIPLFRLLGRAVAFNDNFKAPSGGSSDGNIGKTYIGRLGVKVEGGGKRRVFAMLD